MANPEILHSMLEKFDGCEGGDPGDVNSRSAWIFGVEPGWSLLDKKDAGVIKDPMDDGYSIATQLQWPYNRNAFKLLASMNGYQTQEYVRFAEEYQPFVSGSKGFFKGNLYPYACNNVNEWPADAAHETGLATKGDYKSWCREHRWPVIREWVVEHRPSVFIGVGNSFRDDFSAAVFGKPTNLECRSFLVNGHTKNVFVGRQDDLKLAVIPHLSGGRNGLNSHAAIEQAGLIIRELLAG